MVFANLSCLCLKLNTSQLVFWGENTIWGEKIEDSLCFLDKFQTTTCSEQPALLIAYSRIIMPSSSQFWWKTLRILLKSWNQSCFQKKNRHNFLVLESSIVLVWHGYFHIPFLHSRYNHFSTLTEMGKQDSGLDRKIKSFPKRRETIELGLAMLCGKNLWKW